MTAGRGIVHCEMPYGDTTSHGLQLWVNLAKKNKMVKPAYQELLSKDIPVVKKDGVQVKIIAGESMGVKVQLSFAALSTYYFSSHVIFSVMSLYKSYTIVSWYLLPVYPCFPFL